MASGSKKKKIPEVISTHPYAPPLPKTPEPPPLEIQIFVVGKF